MANRRIDWSRQALLQFNKAILYIAADSLQNAEKVHAEILEKIEGIVVSPERYPPDKYKLQNNGAYRAFELHRLRVAYYIGDDVIRILRVRHTSREPQGY
jgi:plasmid stabilization system protein ParE